MKARDFCNLAGRLLRHPTAPYHEHAVRQEVECICAEHGLASQFDRFGNVLVRLQTARALRPLVLGAHLDHPGFEILRPLSPRRWLAQFQGGVPDSYFRPGIPLRLMPGDVRAKLGRWKNRKRRTFEVLVSRDSTVSPRFAVWDLEDFEVRNHRIVARACDDLIGATSILATMIELKRRRARVNVLGVFSRAEEIGFQGALAIATTGGIPKNSLVLSLETSRELPGVKMGDGVILRVGDRTSIFDSTAMRFLHEVAGKLKAQKKGFAFQRALMGGGTCEATAYQEFGFQCAGLCVALGNYHNRGTRNQIKAEYIDTRDACGMVDLLVASATSMPRFASLTQKLPRRLLAIARRARPKLLQTAPGPDA